MTTTTTQQYDVGGVLLPRPFKIRRLGHIGLNLERLDDAITFYTDLLGFRITDQVNIFEKMPEKARPFVEEIIADPRMIFTSNSSDHHALLLAHRSFDDNMIELYYGIEQIGWQRESRPHDMHYRGFHTVPPLPQMSEAAEVQDAIDKGIDIHSGWTPSEKHLEATYDVCGVLLPRPFKVTRLGPISLFTERMEEMLAFYTEILGFEVVEEAEHLGKRIAYLRSGTEHHTFVLVDKALRSMLGLSDHTSSLSIGFEVGSYSQLRAAVQHLETNAYTVVDGFPAQLYAGIDYAAHLLDPEGHLICLYYYMEQVGWDGEPRPQNQRRAVTQPWPETLTPLSDTYTDQTYMGPLG